MSASTSRERTLAQGDIVNFDNSSDGKKTMGTQQIFMFDKTKGQYVPGGTKNSEDKPWIQD